MEDLKNAFPNSHVSNIYHQTEFGISLVCSFDSEEEQVKRPTSSGKIKLNVPWKVGIPTSFDRLTAFGHRFYYTYLFTILIANSTSKWNLKNS